MDKREKIIKIVFETSMRERWGMIEEKVKANQGLGRTEFSFGLQKLQSKLQWNQSVYFLTQP